MAQKMCEKRENYEITEVFSLEEYLRETFKYKDLGYVFRGEANSNYDLKPTLLRGEDINKISNIENEFKVLEKLFSYFDNYEVDQITIIQIARHFGLKCRFLDFTEDPMIALYFACKDNPNDDAKIICLNKIDYSKKYNQITDQEIRCTNKELITQLFDWNSLSSNATSLLDENGTPIGRVKIAYPIVVYPEFIDYRLSFQSGIFLLWMDLFINEENVNDNIFGFKAEIIINRNSKRDIFIELNKRGYKTENIEIDYSLFFQKFAISGEEFQKLIADLNNEL
jgi:hypothetical protein